MHTWKEWIMLANCMKKHCKKETSAYLTYIHSLHQRYKNKPITVQTIKKNHRQEDLHPTHTKQLQCIKNECEALLHKLLLKLKEKIHIYIQEVKSHKDSRIVQNLINIQKKLESMKEVRLSIQDIKTILNTEWDLWK
jgi:hypothetical protein